MTPFTHSPNNEVFSDYNHHRVRWGQPVMPLPPLRYAASLNETATAHFHRYVGQSHRTLLSDVSHVLRNRPCPGSRQ